MTKYGMEDPDKDQIRSNYIGNGTELGFYLKCKKEITKAF